jgi:SulP family sulfate permease
VPLIDSTAAKTLEAFVRKLNRAKTLVCIAGARASVRRTLLAAGLHEPEALYASTVAAARERAAQSATDAVPQPHMKAPVHAEA